MSGTVESLFIGGQYFDADDGRRMRGQMYVQRWTPDELRSPYPIVMIHGGGQTGATYETTPDGRPGWADFFLAKGFTVYTLDQPARGRSTYQRDADGPQRPASTVERIEERFTASELYESWPQARLHTQWPGSGRAGDPIFDRFYASQVPWLEDLGATEQLMRTAGAALLDEIGEAVVLFHSQAGPLGWQMGDARPDLVKALVAIEPNGPPFFNVDFVGAPEYFRDGANERPWGIAATPLAYDPPISDPAELLPVREPSPGTGLVATYLQGGPVHRLVNLSTIPVLIVTGEASYHASYDRGTVAYLRQAGVGVTHLVLAEHRIAGNGHMMMIEKNSDEIAAAIHRWLRQSGFAS